MLLGSTLKATGAVLGFLILRICATSTVKGPDRLDGGGLEKGGNREQHTAEAQLQRVDFDGHSGRTSNVQRMGGFSDRRRNGLQTRQGTEQDRRDCEVRAKTREASGQVMLEKVACVGARRWRLKKGDKRPSSETCHRKGSHGRSCQVLRHSTEHTDGKAGLLLGDPGSWGPC